jgi:hypothetical protein
MHSYVTPFASSLHNSRVELPTFVPRTLTKAAPIAGVERPRFVLTAPRALHVAVTGVNSDVFFHPPTVPAPPRAEEVGPRLLGSEGHYDGWDWRSWSGQKRALAFAGDEALASDLETCLAVWTDGERWVNVQGISGGERRKSATLIVRFSATTLFESVRIPDHADDAFIANDGRTFVLVPYQGILVYEPSFTGRSSWVMSGSWGPGERSRTIPMPDALAYSISGVGEGIAVLHADKLVRITSAGFWRTSVEVLDTEGRKAWRAELPWSVRQPPIDGGNGRVYAAGDELAALEAGKVVWEVKPGPVHATAFADGAVAYTQGTFLHVRARDGSILVSLETPDKAILVTPPAIASDGSIWVASARDLFVAR